MKISIREYDERSDVGCVYAYWLRSHQRQRHAKDLGARQYYQAQHKIIEQLLDRSETLIACSSEDPDAILGFIVGEPSNHVDVWHYLHYVFVKEAYRSLGVAQQLFDAHRALGNERALVVATHEGDDSLTGKLRGRGVWVKPELAAYLALSDKGEENHETKHRKSA